MNGLQLIGSRPPSRLDTRPLTSCQSTQYVSTDRARNVPETPCDQTESLFGVTRTIHSSNSTHQHNVYTKNNSQNGTNLTVDDTSSSHQLSARSGTSSKPIRRSTKSRGTRVASYVDELLFGAAPEEASFSAPWESTKTKSVINNTTVLRPSSSRVSSRTASARQHSYVDDSLFGDQLEPATWRAPWEKPTRNTRPLVFDANDYRLTIDHKDIQTVKEYKGQSTNTFQQNPNKKLPWR